MLNTIQKQRCLVVLAGVHLIFVGLGAAELRPWAPLGVVGKILDYYGKISGSSSGYGFFAPGVGSQLRASFDIQEAKGTHTERIENQANREADIRIGNIIGGFWTGQTNKAVQRSLAASWAGKMYGRYPEAESVVVRLETYDLPNMKAYRAGARPFWKPYYEAKFLRLGRKAEDKSNG